MAACSHTPPAPVLRAEKCSTAASCHGGRSPAFHCSTGAARSPASARLRPRPGQPRAGASAYVVHVAGDEGAVAGDEVGANGRPIRGATRRRYVRRRRKRSGRLDPPGPASTGTAPGGPPGKTPNCLLTKPKPKNETDKPDLRSRPTSGSKEAVMIASALGHRRPATAFHAPARVTCTGLMRRSGRVR